MGFACFICRLPFGEIPHASEKGDGHFEGSASATRCGHLFHTECLKTVFASQGQDAWVPKFCPVCQTDLSIVNDVFRVQAYLYDFERNKVEDLIKMNKALQTNNREMAKRMDEIFFQSREVECTAEALRTEKQELAHMLEQMRRLDSLHKIENDRLKNIIITLTEKLTGNSFYDNVNNETAINTMQIGYNENRRLSGREARFSHSSSNGNGILLNTSHPPGFLFPLTADNDVEQGSSIMNFSKFDINHNNNDKSQRISGTLFEAHNDQSVVISLNEFPMRDFMNGLAENFDGVDKIPSDGSLIIEDDAYAMTNPSSCSYKQKSSVLSSGSREILEVSKTDNCKEVQRNGESEVNPEVKNVVTKPKNKINSFLEALLSPAPPEKQKLTNEIDNNPWHEKKSKRRTPSASKTDRRCKSDVQPDKQLYSLFSCSTCDAKWGSSNSFFNKPQTCRYCRTEVLPHSQGPILSRKQLELNKESKGVAAIKKN